MHDFTPIPALVGGALIGLSASLLLLTHGKVAGISGIYAGALRSGICGGMEKSGILYHLFCQRLYRKSG